MLELKRSLSWVSVPWEQEVQRELEDSGLGRLTPENPIQGHQDFQEELGEAGLEMLIPGGLMRVEQGVQQELGDPASE